MVTDQHQQWMEERHAIILALSAILMKDNQNASRFSGSVWGIAENGNAATAQEWPIVVITDGGTVLMSYEHAPGESVYYFRIRGDRRVLVVPFTDIHGEPS